MYKLMKIDKHGDVRQSGHVNKLARLKVRLSKFGKTKGWIQEVVTGKVVVARGFSKTCMAAIPSMGVEEI